MHVLTIHARLCFSTLLYSSLKGVAYIMMMLILMLIQQATDETQGVSSTSHLLPPGRSGDPDSILFRLNL